MSIEPDTRYDVYRRGRKGAYLYAPEQTIEQAAELACLDPYDILWSILNYGRADTNNHSVVEHGQPITKA